ncbi:MAG: GTPase ObgE [Anaerolineales bacterium]|nr:GTPase ObgE [Anaerolineales bacterium]
MFIDEARIFVSSGKGGDGAVHFRKEKFVPRGGPDGGDGGRGGDVVLFVDPKKNTLSTFRRQRHFRADEGRPGGGSNKTGRSAEDVRIPVPPGTIVRNEDGAILGDLVEAGQELVIARGGRGGRGNARYATSRNQAPRMAEKGAPGEEKWIELELRLVADVGIIGVPNAGKSTFLASVTNAKPKIAAYPFTTLAPNLGVVELEIDATMVLADIPGIIEGAHAGVGLGFAFLRHVQRTKVLIHMVDGSAQDPLADFSQINTELALFDDRLAQKPQLVAINKIDLPQVREQLPALREAFKQRGYDVLEVSALAREGLRELLWAAYQLLGGLEEKRPDDEELPVYRPEPEIEEFSVELETDGAWRIRGKAVERAADMTYWEYDEAVRRFQGLLAHLGIEQALLEAGVQSGDTVRIGEYELEWVL